MVTSVTQVISEESRSLLTEEQLNGARKVLYMTHLAIGDFTFQGVYLQALKNKYPHLQIDIWIDDCRENSKDWHKGRNIALGQWLDSVSFIDEIYPIALDNNERQQLIEKARECEYDIIVFIATQRSELYAKYARLISQSAYIVGSKSKWLSKLISKHIYFKRLNGHFNLEQLEKNCNGHISDVYRKRFEKCFGPLPLEKDSTGVLRLDIDDQRAVAAQNTLADWAAKSNLENGQCVFINHLSTTPKRDFSWPKVVELIQALHRAHSTLMFVINVPPNAFESVNKQLQSESELASKPVFLFTAQEHFLELPALIQASHYVISVETATMHLAAALGKKQIALMREKAKRWKPTLAEKILYGERHVDDVSVANVVEAFESMYANNEN